MSTIFTALSILLVLDPVQDWIQIRKNKYIKYKWENSLILALVVSILIVGVIIGLEPLKMTAIGLSYPAARWIVHDHLLNILRGKIFNYLGERSNADKFLVLMWNDFNSPPIITRLIALYFSLTNSYMIWTL